MGATAAVWAEVEEVGEEREVGVGLRTGVSNRLRRRTRGSVTQKGELDGGRGGGGMAEEGG
jgi:hypothetical protein